MKPPHKSSLGGLHYLIFPLSRHSSSVGSSGKKGPKMATKRISARLQFRKKLKSMSNKSLPPVIRDEADDKAMEQIEVGNPDHKLLFLKLLGLTPKCSEPIKPVTEMSPVVQLNRLPTKRTSSCLKKSKSQMYWSDDSDIEDLDLEVMFCPLDFPEMYEEITKKPFPTTVKSSISPPPHSVVLPEEKTDQKQNNCGSSESGYDSSTSISSPIRSILPNPVPLSTTTQNIRPKSFSPICIDDHDDSNDCVIIHEISHSNGYKSKPTPFKTFNPNINKCVGGIKKNKTKSGIFQKMHYEHYIPAPWNSYQKYSQTTFEDSNPIQQIKRRLWAQNNWNLSIMTK